ncbi:MAG: phosphoadenylyl-sulfate reductase [Myxococcota bacterium]|nr:phosphoadenylyl-sulfate reductase [Myxococcota bacterium]
MIDFSPYLGEIQQQLEEFQAQGKRMFASSSFQTNSVVLLHLISRFAPQTPIYFLNTGFLFPETFLFRDMLRAQWGLNIMTLRSIQSRHQQVSGDGRFLFASDPDTCCHINKVLPLEPVLQSHDIWINGVRGAQSETRKAMKKIQPAAHGILRYHPILEWDSRMMYYYIEANNLPKHPLDDAGYVSIGCQPCTRSYEDDLDGRGGRWAGLNKTECGLHTTLGGGS